MTFFVIAILVALIVVFAVLTYRAQFPKKKEEPMPEECCMTCRNRYKMPPEDLKVHPCQSGYRCCLDGSIIPDMFGWCIHHNSSVEE